HGVMLERFNPLALAVIEDIPFAARSSAVKPEHLRRMMAEALKVEGFALLDILQPCVSFNKLNTFKWYADRCKELPEKYDPTDRAAALAETQKWGDEIPIGVIYRGKRESFEKLAPALSGEPLAIKYND
ncbi:MAG TPA: 2-oxoacid ferredoxin oxidoreductase, partial [bacterium]|nr:2-oxoacid ferredoxin oxidoreductase [bacterium]